MPRENLVPAVISRLRPLLPALALVAAGCGGGGGGGGGGGPGVSVTASKDQVSASVTYFDDAPTESVMLTATDVPANGLYVGFEYGSYAVQSVDFEQISDTSARVDILLRPPVELEPGAANDDVTIHVCLDSHCGREARGSPITVAVNYTVSDPARASIDTTSLAATASVLEPSGPSRTATITLTNMGSHAPVIRPGDTNDIVRAVTTDLVSAGTLTVRLDFANPTELSTGVHDTEVMIGLCYDAGCMREIQTSPFTIAASYTVTNDAVTEPGLPELPYVSRTALSHDVVDAEWSKEWDILVMVSAQPVNALYVWSAETGTETSVPLVKPPTSVSVSPDGLHAAVGHDALISYVDLASVGQAGAPAPVLLNVSTNVFDIVLDGNGYVHALPAADQWETVHSVYIAGNAERLGTGLLYAGARGRLHPSGNYLYTADNGLSPSDIAKHDIRTGTAVRLYDSPYHGDYAMCGDLWMKEDGTTIYTKCGNAFRSSSTPSLDMLYGGRLQLSASDYYGFRIESLSESDQSHEIALLEHDWYLCEPFLNQYHCFTHLGLYSSDFLTRTALYTLPPIAFNDTRYAQYGLFVFHSVDGTHRYLISRLHGNELANVPQQYYLTVQQ